MQKLFKLFFLFLIVASNFALSQNISIATGGTGGVYYPMGQGLASMLSTKVPGFSATAEVTGGSIDNINLISSGRPYIGFSMADAASDARLGIGRFSGKKLTSTPSLSYIQTKCTSLHRNQAVFVSFKI
jgi:TRAP-type uncharacterized transport system substrate-binding protein